MSREDGAIAPHGSDAEGYVLVCALCGDRLPGEHDSRAEADRAADEHARNEHPVQEAVVVLTVPAAEVTQGLDDTLEQALEAQRQIEEHR